MQLKSSGFSTVWANCNRIYKKKKWFLLAFFFPFNSRSYSFSLYQLKINGTQFIHIHRTQIYSVLYILHDVLNVFLSVGVSSIFFILRCYNFLAQFPLLLNIFQWIAFSLINYSFVASVWYISLFSVFFFAISFAERRSVFIHLLLYNHRKNER